MRRDLLPEEGSFYKANLHCHTNISDGMLSPKEVKELYKSLGYSVVAYTDHDVLIPHDDLTDEKFLALHGFEMEIEDYSVGDWRIHQACHLCFIGIDKNNLVQPMWDNNRKILGNASKYKKLVQYDKNASDYKLEFSKVSEVMNIGRENGFFVTYNHPTWSREQYNQYIAYKGMHAIEMFNGGALTEGFEDYNTRVYDDFLASGNKIYCIGTDDNHNRFPADSRRSDSGKAFTMIKAFDLSYHSITSALVNGDFYCSEGPEIKALWYENGTIYIACSEADRILINSELRYANAVYAETKPITSAQFKVEPKYGYVRLTVIDKTGKRACTNAYYLE